MMYVRDYVVMNFVLTFGVNECLLSYDDIVDFDPWWTFIFDGACVSDWCLERIIIHQMVVVPMSVCPVRLMVAVESPNIKHKN